MPCREIEGIEELRTLAGHEVAISDWVDVTQERIDAFAGATGDHQWIHVDPERARRESPFGGTIAHGYLTLSLLPMLGWQSLWIKQPFRMTINYGANRIRFPNPVRTGSRVRSRTAVLAVTDVDDGWQVIWKVTVEIEGAPKPALVAETISRYVR